MIPTPYRDETCSNPKCRDNALDIAILQRDLAQAQKGIALAEKDDAKIFWRALWRGLGCATIGGLIAGAGAEWSSMGLHVGGIVLAVGSGILTVIRIIARAVAAP